MILGVLVTGGFLVFNFSSSVSVDDVESEGISGITAMVVATVSECLDIEDVGNQQCHPTRRNRIQECIEKINRRGSVSYRWHNVRCDRGMVCVEGECGCSETNACDVQGAKQCTRGRNFQECLPDANGCLKWSNHDASGNRNRCDRGLACVGEGECGCTLKNACDVEGGGRCSTVARSQVCTLDGNSCLKWVNGDRCSRTEFCSEGECVDGDRTDAEICEIGERTCIGNRVRECEFNGRFNLWVAQDRCARGELCSDGVCVVNHCFNQRMDEDEEGVDCGGSCEVCGASGVVSLCGDGIVVSPEVCEIGETQECSDSGYSGNQNCNADCSGFDSCIVGSCGDGILNGPEECEDGNVLDGDGCSSSCEVETPTSEESVGVDLEESQFLVSVGGSIQISINTGSQISVTYEELRENLVLLRVLEITTEETSEGSEIRTITVDDIGDGKISVSVE